MPDPEQPNKTKSDPAPSKTVASQPAAPPSAESPSTPSKPKPQQRTLKSLGDYTLKRKLGAGGMGTVYEAVQERLGKRVALKVLPKERTGNADLLKRFQREMKAVGNLNHPNIIQAFDAREEHGIHFLVLEYADGADLADIAKRHGRFTVADACEVIRQAALGLQHAHEHGLVHRDVKPANLFLTRDGTVKVLDLGLALLNSRSAGGAENADQAAGDGLTETGQIMGTLDYIAPEQITSTHHVDIRADLYSLGCTLYLLLTGCTPFSGDEYSTAFLKMKAHTEAAATALTLVRPDVPFEVVDIVEKLMAKQPDERFETPQHVADAVSSWCVDADLPSLLAPVTDADAATDSPATKPTPTASHISRTGMTETVVRRSADKKAEQNDSAPLASVSIDTSGETDLLTKLHRRSNRSRPPWKAFAGIATALLAGAILLMFGGQIIRVATGRGLLIIEADDRGIEVTVTRGEDKSPVTIHDKSTNRRYTLDIGDDYRVVVTEPATGVSFQSDRLTITRGGRNVLDVSAKLAESVPSAKSAGGTGPAKIPEPLPLEEWLKGREILTVAQDDSGQFKTIQAALDALKPGQVVEVLDKGPYVETLIKTLPGDTGLVTRVGTVLRVAEWQQSASEDPQWPHGGHLLSGSPGFRLSGFVFASVPVKGGRELRFYPDSDGIIEDCHFLSSLPFTESGGFRNLQTG